MALKALPPLPSSFVATFFMDFFRSSEKVCFFLVARPIKKYVFCGFPHSIHITYTSTTILNQIKEKVAVLWEYFFVPYQIELYHLVTRLCLFKETKLLKDSWLTTLIFFAAFKFCWCRWITFTIKSLSINRLNVFNVIKFLCFWIILSLKKFYCVFSTTKSVSLTWWI